jgi:hypothetical protein
MSIPQLILLEQFDNVAEQVGRCRLVHHDFSCGWVGEMVAVGVCLIAANLIQITDAGFNLE